MNIVFVVTVIKSCGEAYQAIRAARSLEEHGNKVLFIAMPEVADFVARHGFQVRQLYIRKEENKKMVASIIKEMAPHAVVYASFRNMFLGIGIGKVFDTAWFNGKGIKQFTFDPENYPRHWRSISAGPLINRTYPLTRIPDDMKVLSTDILEGVRAPERTFFYRPEYPALDKVACRKKLGWAMDAQIVLFPLSRWIYDNTVYFGSGYYTEYLPNLIHHYALQLKRPLTICTIGHKNIFTGDRWGDVAIAHEPVQTIEEYEQRVAAADLLLTDNGMSGSIEIATAMHTPVLVLKSSITASLQFGALKTTAPFTVSPFVQELLMRMLSEKAKSVFPFAVYPLGWWDVVEHLFEDNPLYDTFSEAELFDETSVLSMLKQLLWDTAFQKKIRALQDRYAEKQRALNTFPELLKVLV